MAWDDSNIEYLRAMEDPYEEGDSEVAKFVCWEDPDFDYRMIRAQSAESCGMAEFDWVDLAGNHQYHLVTVSSSLDYSFHNSLRIYSRDSFGKISEQQFDGYFIRLAGIAQRKSGPLRIYTPLYDLNGDSKVELVILDALDREYSGGPFGSHALALWPKVYSLKKGKYIESSPEFATFYDTEILPRLNSVTSKGPKEAARMIPSRPTPSSPVFNTGTAQPEELLAAAEMARDKILRVLGRDPTAGEQQARQWMTSPDPELRHDAVVVFRDIGGHGADLAEAERKEQELEASLPGFNGLRRPPAPAGYSIGTVK